MVTQAELLAGVEAAFEVTGRGLARWPAPHPDRSPRDDEYSRVTDPNKWRIIGARAEAWLVALTDGGLGVVEPGASVRWKVPPGTVISRTDRLVPHATDALPLVVARSRIQDIDDAGVTLGAGDPAVCVARIPLCGCDACDDGAQHELDQLDTSILAVVRGEFRRLSNGDHEITVLGDSSWTTSAVRRRDVRAVLTEPSRWNEVSGAPWLSTP